MPTYREQPCCVCGQLVNKRVRGGRKVYCADHSAEAAANANRQMMQKAGPIYERWREANVKAAARLLSEMSEVGHP